MVSCRTHYIHSRHDDDDVDDVSRLNCFLNTLQSRLVPVHCIVCIGVRAEKNKRNMENYLLIVNELTVPVSTVD